MLFLHKRYLWSISKPGNWLNHISPFPFQTCSLSFILLFISAFPYHFVGTREACCSHPPFSLLLSLSLFLNSHGVLSIYSVENPGIVHAASHLNHIIFGGEHLFILQLREEEMKTETQPLQSHTA